MLKDYFGDSAQIKIIEFLGKDFNNCYSLVEIRDKAGVSYATIKRIVPNLLSKKIVLIKRKVGKSRLYSLNKNHRIIKKIRSEL